MKEETILKIRGIIADKLDVPIKEVTDEASFANNLGADSLDLVELIMAMEEEFDLSIPDEEAEKLLTVQTVLDYLKKNLPEE